MQAVTRKCRGAATANSPGRQPGVSIASCGYSPAGATASRSRSVIRTNGSAAVLTLKQEAILKRNVVTIQQFHKLISKRPLTMMFFLPLNVSSNNVNLRLADGERSISRLPFETVDIVSAFVDPFRRSGFDLSQHVGHRNRRRESHEDVNVIRHAPNLNHVSFLISNDAADVRIEIVAKISRDAAPTVFCSEDDVIRERCECGHSRIPFGRSGIFTAIVSNVGVAPPGLSVRARHCFPRANARGYSQLPLRGNSPWLDCTSFRRCVVTWTRSMKPFRRTVRNLSTLDSRLWTHA